MFRRIAVAVFDRLWACLRGKDSVKHFHELRYWKTRHAEEGDLSCNDWYRVNYTARFGLPASFYADKRVLDVGCGPRGSLEWATMARERVGLDPLADKYRGLGTRNHAMSYVTACSEAIPFEDGHFDVVMAMNSLDHVADVPRTVAEIVRVVTGGGTILVLTSIDHPSTSTEPQSFGPEVFKLFSGCRIASWEHLERPEGERRWDIPFNEDDLTPRMSGLAVRLEKLTPPEMRGVGAA
jgi:SAM-dependent methyltransferase